MLFELTHHHLSPQVQQNEYVANFIVTSLSTCPGLLQPSVRSDVSPLHVFAFRYFHLIARDPLSSRSKHFLKTLPFLGEIFEQQKPVDTWSSIYQNVTDSTPLTDIFIHLIIPMDVMNIFDSIVSKNVDLEIQFVAIKFLSSLLKHIEGALNLFKVSHFLVTRTTPWNRINKRFSESNSLLFSSRSSMSLFQFIPAPDHFCDSLNVMKTMELSDDVRIRLIDEYLHLLLRYSSPCFMSMSAMNLDLDLLLSNSLVHLLISLHESPLPEKDFQCLTNLLHYRESIDDVIWARNVREFGVSPLRMLLKLSKNFQQIGTSLASVGEEKKTRRRGRRGGDFRSSRKSPRCFNIVRNCWSGLTRGSEVERRRRSNSSFRIVSRRSFSIRIHCWRRATRTTGQIDRSSRLVSSHFSSQQFESDDLHRSRVDSTRQTERRISVRRDLSNLRRTNGSSIARHALSTLQTNFSRRTIDDEDLSSDRFENRSRSHSDSFDDEIDFVQTQRVEFVDFDRGNDPMFEHPRSSPQRSSSIVRRAVRHDRRSSSTFDRRGRTNETSLPIDRRTRSTTSEKGRDVEIVRRSSSMSRTSDPFLRQIFVRRLSRRISPFDLSILFREIKSNPKIVDQMFFPSDCRSSEALQWDGSSPLDRMKKKEWKNIFETETEIHWEISNEELGESFSSNIDQPIQRLSDKSPRSPLLLAQVFRQLFRDDQRCNVEAMFNDYLPLLIRHHSAEPLVFDFLQTFNETFPEEKQRLIPLFQTKDSPQEETNRLLLFLKFFPHETSIAEEMYQSLVQQAKTLFQSADVEPWANVFNQCTKILLAERISSIKHDELITSILKSFATLTKTSLELIKSLLQSFLIDPNFDRKVSAKLFARPLKHPNFLDALASTSILVDLLSLFLGNYNAELSSVTIDCAKHFPMLLAISHPTLSEHDQHILSCMYQYEKAGYSMQSAFVWGRAAWKHYSTTDSKTVLFHTSKLEQVMDLLDERIMSRSIRFYPVTRRLRVSDRRRISRRFSL